MNCKSDNLIYLLYCAKCSSKQYVGETQQTLTGRFAGHRSDINRNLVKKCVHVVTHFNLPGHSLEDMRVIPIEKMHYSDRQFRKTRERFWCNKLKTLYPFGLNELG